MLLSVLTHALARMQATQLGAGASGVQHGSSMFADGMWREHFEEA